MKKADMRSARTSGNVFLHLGFTPHEAAVLLLWCEIVEAIGKWIDREKVTQRHAAKWLGVVQPRISEIVCNNVDNLSLDYLVGLCAKAGVSVTVKSATGVLTNLKTICVLNTVLTMRRPNQTASRLAWRKVPSNHPRSGCRCGLSFFRCGQHLPAIHYHDNVRAKSSAKLRNRDILSFAAGSGYFSECPRESCHARLEVTGFHVGMTPERELE